MIKFWAWVYRTFGYYYPGVDSYILKTLQQRADSMESRLNLCKDELNLRNIINIEIGTWQAIHGFTRPFNPDRSIKLAKKALKRHKHTIDKLKRND